MARKICIQIETTRHSNTWFDGALRQICVQNWECYQMKRVKVRIWTSAGLASSIIDSAIQHREHYHNDQTGSTHHRRLVSKQNCGNTRIWTVMLVLGCWYSTKLAEFAIFPCTMCIFRHLLQQIISSDRTWFLHRFGEVPFISCCKEALHLLWRSREYISPANLKYIAFHSITSPVHCSFTCDTDQQPASNQNRLP